MLRLCYVMDVLVYMVLLILLFARVVAGCLLMFGGDCCGLGV